MRALARIGLLLLAGLFIVVFCFGAFRFSREVGVSPTRYVVQDALVMVAGLLGFVACLMKSRKLQKQRQAELDSFEFTGQRFETNTGKAMAVLVGVAFLLALIATFVTATSTAIDPKAVSAATLFLLVSAFLLSLALSTFRSGKPTLVMDAFALDHAWYGPIRWDQIQGIYLREVRMRNTTQRTMFLSVFKPGRYLGHGLWWQRLFLTSKRREAPVGDIAIPLNPLDQPASKIHKAALTLRARVSPQLLANWVPGMSAEAIDLQRETDATLQRLGEIGNALEHGRLAPEAADLEMQRVMEDLERQTTARLPHAQKQLAQARRLKYFNYAIISAAVLYFVLRVFFRSN